MDGTTALAIWGAFTGTVSVVFQGVTSFRDRVHLNVNVRTQQTALEDVLLIEVSNRGRQPTTIIEAGFLVKAAADFEVVGRGFSHTAPFSIRWDDGNPVLLKPGEVHQFTHKMTTWPDPMAHADMPLRAYVKDSHGRKSWGSPIPILRIMVSSGWEPQDLDPDMVEPPDEPFVAEPVTARWKLWRPREERKATVWDPGEVNVTINSHIKDD
jgi:hypothetical protein